MSILRRIGIRLRSLHIRYVRGHRNRMSLQEMNAIHYAEAVRAVPGMLKSIANRG